MPETEKSGNLKAVMKWIGVVTAVLSLLFGLQKFVAWVLDYQEKKEHVSELLDLGKLQLRSHDYPAAWESLTQAAELDDEHEELVRQREATAMIWLRNIRIADGQTFTEIVDKILPVLSMGAIKNEGSYKADLLAHLGWADFLRWREGNRSLQPEQQYLQALAVDSSNTYANTMYGHWLMWQREGVEKASPYFAAAVSSGREREYVRGLQLSALFNDASDAIEAEMVQICNDMRKGGEALQSRDLGRIFSTYTSRTGRIRSADPATGEFDAIVPAEEELATFIWLFEDSSYKDRREYKLVLATLQEAAGQKEAALQTAQGLKETLSPGNWFMKEAEAIIARLKPKS